ncbi:MAG: phosphomannomutase/phosphoglucomutase [Betaproteobacteria bacterium]|nr:phosphomannomutase/phosphoglucomutase [Betaproteobacteria bacterium]
MPLKTPIAPEIFKAYDIRGIAGKTLDAATARLVGQALGTLANERADEQDSGERPAIVVGRDGRFSGPELAAALQEGIRSAGVDTLDIGCVPTPVTYFAAEHLGAGSCVSVTGSHNPPEYNGLKMVIARQTLAGDEIQALRQRIVDGNLHSRPGGKAQDADVIPAYLDRVVSGIELARPMKIAIDCGNGVAGAIAPELFRRLGCMAEELFCAVDGAFPNHHPDPSKPENLRDLVAALAAGKGEIGLAFDGDGDRLGVVTRDGEIIYPDRQLMLFAADVLQRVPGAEIIYDVKCTRLLRSWIESHGGRATMWRTGHALIKRKLKESGAPLAGEMSGHMFFKERWYGFDDGLYAAARLLEILSRAPDASALLSALPNSASTPEINIPMAEGEPFALTAALQDGDFFSGAREIIRIDGIRAEYADGFGLARPSNTTPVLVLRFEADNEKALARIQADFRSALQSLRPELALPF